MHRSILLRGELHCQAGYFTGAYEPYEKLKRVLSAEIDEKAWAVLDSRKRMRSILKGTVVEIPRWRNWSIANYCLRSCKLI